MYEYEHLHGHFDLSHINMDIFDAWCNNVHGQFELTYEQGHRFFWLVTHKDILIFVDIYPQWFATFPSGVRLEWQVHCGIVCVYSMRCSTTHGTPRWRRLCLPSSWSWCPSCCWTCWSPWWATPTTRSSPSRRRSGADRYHQLLFISPLLCLLLVQPVDAAVNPSRWCGSSSGLLTQKFIPLLTRWLIQHIIAAVSPAC